MKNRRLLSVILGLCIMMSILPAVASADSQQYVYTSSDQWIQVENGKTTAPLKAFWGSLKGTVNVGAAISTYKGLDVITKGNFAGKECIIMDGTFVTDSGAVYTINNMVPTLSSTPSEPKPAVAAEPVISNSATITKPDISQPATVSQPNDAQQSQKIKVILDGKSLGFSQDPVIQNGSVLVPFRKILEEMGAIVQYDVNSHQIEAICASKGLVILFSAGNPQATIIHNGGKTDTYTMPQPAVVINNSTLVPIRFISETLGNKVSWDPVTKTVNIVGSAQAASAGDDRIKITVTKVNRAEGNPKLSQPAMLPNSKQSQYDSVAPSGYEYIVVEYTMNLAASGFKVRGVGSDSILYDTSGKDYESKHCLMQNIICGTDWRNDYWVGDDAKCEVDFLVPKGTSPDYMNLQYTYQTGSSAEKKTAIIKVPLAGKS